MTLNRHLLPHEFDLLLDEEVGFGIAPLHTHVRDCSACAAELAVSQAVMRHVERVPHLAPSPLFTERVMTRVQVFRPWYATALDIARRLVPSPGPIRTAVAAGAAMAALTLTVLGLWIATRADAFLVLVGVAADQGRRVAVEFAGALWGGTATAAVETGGSGVILLGVAALVASTALAIAGISVAARAVRARR